MNSSNEREPPMMLRQIDIETPDGTCDVWLVHPDDGMPHPAVLFFMDAFGPRDWLYTMATTIAAHGYSVLLPNLFYRVRRAPVIDMAFPVRADDMPLLIGQIRPLFQHFTPEQGLQDTGVFINFLNRQEQVLPGKIAITGYCMGGSLAIRAAARYPDRVAAVASFHAGNLATETPDSPYRLLGQIVGELYIAHADHDASMPAEQIARLQQALESSSVRYEAELYRGAAHGFTMADLPAYDAAALDRHWKKLLALLERTLVMQ